MATEVQEPILPWAVVVPTEDGLRKVAETDSEKNAQLMADALVEAGVRATYFLQPLEF